MEGEIVVTSVLTQGSEFSFSLPLLEADNSNVSDDIAVKKIDLNQKLDGKILLVEDNKTNQMLMNIILGKLGLDVDIANNGQEGFEKFKENQYDLILMDENMPIMNGLEATKNILSFEKEFKQEHTPIIALTANALATDRAKFLNAGMDEFVPKPIDHEMLVRVLHSFLL